MKYTCLVLLSLLILSVLGEESLYDLLGVRQDATEQEIKKAFRKMSILYHPDKNPGDDEASEKFTRINRANEVLSDKDKRAVYDTSGLDGVKKFESGNFQMNKGQDEYSNLYVSLEDLYLGTERKLTIRKNELCPSCRGTGAKDGEMKTCSKCKGRGAVKEKIQMGFMQMEAMNTCSQCSGKGKVIKKACPVCGARKVMMVSKDLEVTVEKGMAHDDQIVFEREGQQVPDVIPGDVVFVIKQQKHDKFERKGNNLHTAITISLEESLMGFKRRISHLDGHLVEVSSNEGEIIQPFQVKIIKEEGMPVKGYPSEFGDLHVKIKIEFPKQLSEAQKKIVEDML